MTTKPIGIYIHIPFCVRKCNYCDFCSYPVSDFSNRNEYIDCLCSEIESYSDREIEVDSIFFGGGTPSLLTNEEFDRIVSTIRKTFVVLPHTEFTVEANPGTLDEEKIVSFVSLGVNRLSIGLQSIHDNEEKKLGRIHNYDDFVKVYTSAKKLGIQNINVDLMYGIPSQSMESFEMTLRSVAELSPEHLSVYGLIIEEGTPFYDVRDRLDVPSEDIECDMYYLARDILSELGYHHYEVSNYARESYECRHNLKYWENDEFIGFGVSAYSYFEGERFGNSRDISEYLSTDREKYIARESVDKDSMAYEYVMLHLRLARGFSLTEYRERFGRDFLIGREELVNSYVENGLMLLSDDRILLTDYGLYVSNTILTELL